MLIEAAKLAWSNDENTVTVDKATAALGVAREDSDRATAYFWQGVGYYRLNRYQESEAALKQAVAHDPHFAAPYVTLAAVQYDGYQNIDKGCEYAKKAVELDATYSWAHNSLGTCYQLKHDKINATKEFKEAIRLEPGNTVFRTNLSRLK